MSIAKLLVATALCAAPIGLASAQSTAPADSGNDGHHLREWLAGTGAAAGAGVFMAFTHSGNAKSGSSSDVSFHSPTVPPTNHPSADPTGDTAQPGQTDTPTDTTTVTPPPGPSANPPIINDGNPPSTDGPLGPTDNPPSTNNPLLPPDASTVPEPGSAALLATGIVGLVPLLRKRRK